MSCDKKEAFRLESLFFLYGIYARISRTLRS